jgi:glycosyltransferase involved in cell wall biosynthesis
MNIPIVIPAYNRVECLERLLNSLNKASYNIEVKLILSIDGGGTEGVIKTADSFNWKHGVKEIIKHKVNLGLRNHILQCGRLSNQYDGIILLEDDLYVASNFYNYTIKMQQFYKDTSEIAGVALYSHSYNETACLPFTAIEDGFDVFFMQIACSWGQCWLSSQWNDFDEWYQINKNIDLKVGESLPPDVRLWPDSSWKKYKIKYLIEKNKFYVYPRSSYSTNFGVSSVRLTFK